MFLWIGIASFEVYIEAKLYLPIKPQLGQTMAAEFVEHLVLVWRSCRSCVEPTCCIASLLHAHVALARTPTPRPVATLALALR